jgi:hypothetical protein
MAPERLLHASTGHHDATRSRLVRIYIFIQIVTFPIHPFLLSLNASFSCKDRDGVMGIQSNTYARTFNQPSIPCGCRGQHNTQWNFSVSHTTQKQSIIICFKKKIIMYPSCMASLHMSRLSRTHDQYSLLILLPSPNSRLPSLVYYAIRLMNSMCL